MPCVGLFIGAHTLNGTRPCVGCWIARVFFVLRALSSQDADTGHILKLSTSPRAVDLI